LEGTIIIESGATSIDRKPKGGSLWENTSDAGSYVFKAGAIAIVADSVLIGPSSGSNKGEMLQLNSGEITLKATGYELDGNAALVSMFGISTGMTLKMTGTSTLTIAGGGHLHGFEQSSAFLADGSITAGAKIVLQDSSSWLSVQKTMSSKPSIEGVDWTTAESVTIDAADDSWRITGPAILVKVANGWAKQ
jgi:hypothetical protein